MAGRYKSDFAEDSNFYLRRSGHCHGFNTLLVIVFPICSTSFEYRTRSIPWAVPDSLRRLDLPLVRLGFHLCWQGDTRSY